MFPEHSDIGQHFNTRLFVHLYGLLVNGSGVGDAVYLGCSLDVDVEHLMALARIHSLCGSLVHGHRMARKAVLLFQLCVQQIYGCQSEIICDETSRWQMVRPVKLRKTSTYQSKKQQAIKF